MLTLQSLILTYDPSQHLNKSDNQDCYICITLNNNQHFSKTVRPSQNIFKWNIKQEDIKVSRRGNICLSLSLIHYDTCKIIKQYSIELTDSSICRKNNSYEELFGTKQDRSKVEIKFMAVDSSEIGHSESIIKFGRNSKKTNTTNHQQPSAGSIFEKVHSLKHIVSHQRDMLTFSSSQSPKSIAELAYLRSFRQNLEKRLFNSIEMGNKGKKQYIL